MMNKIPYKTCRLLIILGPFSEKGTQKYQKSITFFTKSGWCFTTTQNIKKALVLEHFGASRKVHKNTLQHLSFMEPFWTIFAKRHSKVSKKH